jgi:hypothetical protein
MSATLRFGQTSQVLAAITQATPPFRDIRDSDRWELLDTLWVDLSGAATGAALSWTAPGGAGFVYRRYAPLLRKEAAGEGGGGGLVYVNEPGDVAGAEGVEFLARGACNETLVLRAGSQHIRAVGLFEGRRTITAASPAPPVGPRVFTALVANGSWANATNVVVTHVGAAAFEIDILRARR